MTWDRDRRQEPAGDGPGGIRRTVDLLAHAYGSYGSALVVLVNIGFPRKHMPWFENPTSFWTRILLEIDGRIENGVAKLVLYAAEDYPFDQALQKLAAPFRPPAALVSPAASGLMLPGEQDQEALLRVVRDSLSAPLSDAQARQVLLDYADQHRQYAQRHWGIATALETAATLLPLLGPDDGGGVAGLPFRDESDRSEGTESEGPAILPENKDDSGPIATVPAQDLGLDGDYSSLLLVGSELYRPFLRIVQDSQGGSYLEIYYVSPRQSAVGIPIQPDQGEALISRLSEPVRQGCGPQARLRYEQTLFRPYIYSRLFVTGPGDAAFQLSWVPATATARDVADAVIAQYANAPADPWGKVIRAVVERTGDGPGRERRLAPDEFLHNAGVVDEDRLLVRWPMAAHGGRRVADRHGGPGPHGRNPGSAPNHYRRSA